MALCQSVVMMSKLLKAPVRLLAAHFGEHRRSRDDARLWVLMYHRILPSSDSRFAAEEPGMLVTPESLDMQLAVAARHFEFVRLGDWLRSHEAGETLPAKACAITFDDGWSDNVEFALPILEKHNAPATIFLVSDMIGSKLRFWPNRLAVLLGEKTAAEHSSMHWLQERLAASGISLPTRPNEEQLAVIIDVCKLLPDDLLLHYIARAEQALNIAPADTADMISEAQFDQLAAHPLIDLGSHTCKHFRLNDSLDPDTATAEIRDSRQALETRLQRPVDLFCYPNGDYTEGARQQVERTYTGAVTTATGINTANSEMSAHTLKRIAINEGGSNSALRFESLLSGWF